MRMSVVGRGFAAVGCLLLLGTLGSAAEKSKHVLVIGVDGCRPDALQAASTPHLDKLIDGGTLATATDILAPRETKGDTISGPGWSNILTGVWPDKHGCLDNKFGGTNYREYPHFFARLKESRPKAFTVSLSTWKPIDANILSAADVHQDFEEKDYVVADRNMTARAVEVLQTTNPTAMVVYLGNVDVAGHTHGFHPRVPEYIAAIEQVDAQVGEIQAALRARKTFANEDWLTIVCTDHGGVGKNHGGGREMPEIRNVFLIVSGESAAKGTVDTPTYQVDVVATALKHLGVTPKAEWKLDGRPVGLK